MAQTAGGQPKNVVAFIGFVLFVVFAGVMIERCDAFFRESPETYVLDLGDDLGSLTANRDDLGLSLVLVVDVSGSMDDPPLSGGEKKYLQATRALGSVMSALRRLVAREDQAMVIKLGLIRFSSTVETVMPLQEITRSNIDQISSFMNNPKNWVPRGSTAIGDALVEGTRMLARSGTIMRSLVLITDGESNTGTDPEYVLDALYNNRNNLSTPEYTVFTRDYLVRVIGFDIDSEVFRAYESYGVRLASAADEKQLTEVLRGLIEADITKLEAPSF